MVFSFVHPTGVIRVAVVSNIENENMIEALQFIGARSLSSVSIRISHPNDFYILHLTEINKSMF
jgi:hypothetical protein